MTLAVVSLTERNLMGRRTALYTPLALP